MTSTSNCVKNNTQSVFIKAAEVATMMDISRAYAYRIVRRLNAELEAKGILTIDGRTNRKYFLERCYGTVSV